MRESTKERVKNMFWGAVLLLVSSASLIGGIETAVEAGFALARLDVSTIITVALLAFVGAWVGDGISISVESPRIEVFPRHPEDESKPAK